MKMLGGEKEINIKARVGAQKLFVMMIIILN